MGLFLYRLVLGWTKKNNFQKASKSMRRKIRSKYHPKTSNRHFSNHKSKLFGSSRVLFNRSNFWDIKTREHFCEILTWHTVKIFFSAIVPEPTECQILFCVLLKPQLQRRHAYPFASIINLEISGGKYHKSLSISPGRDHRREHRRSIPLLTFVLSFSFLSKNPQLF